MKKLFTLLLAALCCVHLSIACCYIGPYQKFIVRDRTTNEPLKGATITILYQNKPVRNITLDSTGIFFTYLWSDEHLHTVVIKLEGYIGLTHPLKVSEDNNMEITVLLSKDKRAKIKVHEIQRYRRVKQDAITQVQLEEHMAKSVNTDVAYHTMSCHMQHQNRKDQSQLSKEGKLFNEVNVYPNPITSGTQLYVESKFDEQKELVIYNMAGLEVYRTLIVFHSVIETSGLEPGIYILKVIDSKNDDVVIQKFLIQ